MKLKFLLFLLYRRGDRRDDRRKFDRKDRNQHNDRSCGDYDRNRDRGRREDHRRTSPHRDSNKRRDAPSNHNREDRGGGRRYNETSPSKSCYNKSSSPSAHRNQSNDETDSCSNHQSNTSTNNKPINYRSRSIERRAQEKVQQLQRLGIEIPALTAVANASLLTKPPQPLLPIPLIPPLPLPLPQQLNACTITPAITTSETTTTKTANETTTTAQPADSNLSLNLSNFTSPVLVNPRYTEQMQKKKLIWGSKKTQSEANGNATTGMPMTNNKWETAKFSQDTDGKVASKFLRLMGVKNAEAVTKSIDTNAVEASDDTNIKKREEMFTSMEQQYEMARQATHTMRGVGLGFGSQGRPY